MLQYFRMDQKLAWWVSAATSCVDSVAHIYQAELGPGACVLAFVLGMIVYRYVPVLFFSRCGRR